MVQSGDDANILHLPSVPDGVEPEGVGAPRGDVPTRDDPAIEAPDVAAMFEQATSIALGIASALAHSLQDGIETTFPANEPGDEEITSRRDPIALGVGAALGAGLAALEWSARAAETAVRLAMPLFSLAGRPAPVRRGLAKAEEALTSLDARWRKEKPGAEFAASRFVGALVPQVVDGVLNQLDLTALIAQRLDVDALVAAVDLDAVLAGIDLDALVAAVDLNAVLDRIDIALIIDRIDVDAIVSKVDFDAVVSRIDLNQVAARIDIDEVASRIDLDQIISRVDLAGIASRVIEEIDLPEIIRESSGAVASETVRSVRMQGIGADRAIDSFVDRALRRRDGRDTDGPSGPPNSDG